MLVSRINSNPNRQNFQARNAEIRYADDVMRHLNRQFQSFSLFMHANFLEKNSDRLTKKQISKLKKLGNILFYSKVTRPDPQCAPDEYTKRLVGDVLTNKLSNCREKCGLSKMSLAINGINSKIVSLYGRSKSGELIDLDHLLTIAKLNSNSEMIDVKALDEKTYVMDSLEGIVDYSPSAFKKLEGIFSKTIKENEIESLCVQVEDFEINEKLISELASEFPSLKVSKNHY